MPRHDTLLNRREWIVVGALTATALVLRIAMAQGSLWLDEVWSAIHARQVGTPLGVFLGINHDNNHHLNSLWMQAVGINAPPVVQRALAIVAGTAAVPVAAMIARRSGGASALIAAAFFALSPFFAHYGSEARGYALMILALLVVVLHVDRWLHGAPRPTTALVLWTIIGLLSQLTMVIGLVAVVGWAGLTLARRSSLPHAAAEALRGFAPAALAAGIVVGGVLLAARLDSGGMRFGAYQPFTYADQWRALVAIAGYPFGAGLDAVWALVAVVLLLTLAAWMRAPLTIFYGLSIVAFPLAVALLHPANPGHPRYYALFAVAAGLLIADVGDIAWRKGGWWRTATIVTLSALGTACVVEDARLIANQRADTSRAIGMLQRLAPAGTTLLVEEPSAAPVVALAARRARYHLTITAAPCPAAPFLFVDQYNDEQFASAERRCGRTYRPIATLHGRGMANFHWRLYRRQ